MGGCRLQLTPLPKHAIANPCAAQGDLPLDPVRLPGRGGGWGEPSLPSGGCGWGRASPSGYGWGWVG